MMRPGARLSNGATAVAVLRQVRSSMEQTGGVVLAVRDDGHQPYVTWQFNDDSSTYWGHYFADLKEAVEDFEKRSKS